jgi:hypothetical protein
MEGRKKGKEEKALDRDLDQQERREKELEDFEKMMRSSHTYKRGKGGAIKQIN